MQHIIPVESLGPLGEHMAQAVEKCVHCGFCLPACPTYNVLGEEMDSPRGRIILMKSVLEGQVDLEEALPYVDRCLGCLGCVSVCPSGVPYGELVTPFRAYAQERRRRPFTQRAARSLALNTLPYPGRFRLAAITGNAARPVQGLLPEPLRAMLDLLPGSLPPSQPLPELYPAQGQRRARVALLAGCAQLALAPQINWAGLRVLARNGVEVVIPHGQGCCGALALHTGELELARLQAAHNLGIFPEDVDAIITTAAGCGSGMKEYPHLFQMAAEGATDEMELMERVERFARKVQDISVFLDSLGIAAPPGLPQPFKLAYHDACHLAHAQRVTEAPRRLLRQIANLTLVPLPESDLCCGSAGTYNIEQPETAHLLGERKAKHILGTGAQAVTTGNIGCMVQIQTHLAELGQPLPVWHTLEVLDRAYHGWD
jgi:glycolate oxidase iron-sulfur subunit